MKTLLFKCATALILSALWTVNASSSILTSTVQVDDSFEILLSADDGVPGVRFGSGTLWHTVYTHSVTLASGVDYYLHVRAENLGGPGGFIGSFSIAGGEHLFVNDSTALATNTYDWNGNFSGWGDPYLALADSGSPPAGFPPSAQEILIPDGRAAGYFSTMILAVNPIPEPAAALLMGIGLLALANLARKIY